MKNKTYAETQGEKPFDWNEFLNKESISEEEWGEATELAAGWVTCAVGNQCAIIPRNKFDAPDDDELIYLGKDFLDEIKIRHVASAKMTLQKIEARSAELIAEIEANNLKNGPTGI